MEVIIYQNDTPFLPGQEDRSMLPIMRCFASKVIARPLLIGVVFNPEEVWSREGKSRAFPVSPVFMASCRACETETPSLSPG